MQLILQFLSARTVLAVKDLNHQLHMFIKHHIPIWMRLFLVIGSMLQNPKKNLWWIKFWPTWIICKTWWIQCSQTCRSWLGPPCTFHPLRHPWTWARNSAGTVSSAFSDGGTFTTSLQRYVERCSRCFLILNIKTVVSVGSISSTLFSVLLHLIWPSETEWIWCSSDY